MADANNDVVCLGDNYEQGIPISNVSLPTVSLTSYLIRKSVELQKVLKLMLHYLYFAY